MNKVAHTLQKTHNHARLARESQIDGYLEWASPFVLRRGSRKGREQRARVLAASAANAAAISPARFESRVPRNFNIRLRATRTSAFVWLPRGLQLA